MQIKLLAFGHLPKFKGGKQHSGLANVEWCIAHSLNRLSDSINVVFCATDIHTQMSEIDGLPIVGWSPISLARALVMDPGKTISILLRLPQLCRNHDLPLLRTFFKALLLADAIRQNTPDYIHLHGCESVAYLSLGLFQQDKALVTIHGLIGEDGPEHLMQLEKALGKLQLKSLVFVSKDILAKWIQVYGQPEASTEVVPNAFDKTTFYPPAGTPKQKGGQKKIYNLTTIGSISNNKGQMRVIEAIAKLKSLTAAHAVEYTIVGEGLNPNQTQQMLQKACHSGIKVRHMPFQFPNELRKVLWESDFMILPSMHEGFGLVFLESIASGTPIILPRNLPICREDGLISPKNSIQIEDASVQAILTALLDLPNNSFINTEVALSIAGHDWSDVAERYYQMLSH